MQARSGWMLALLLSVTPILAQQDPGTGRWAAGGDLGWAHPLGDDRYDGSIFLDGFFEYRQSEVLSWRGMLWYTSFDGHGNDVGVLAGNANVVYEWKGRKARPYLTAGIGLYDYDPDLGSGGLEFGIDFGGGVNLPVARAVDLRIEGTFHGTTADEPDSFFLLSFGARYRFGG